MPHDMATEVRYKKRAYILKKNVKNIFYNAMEVVLLKHVL